MNAYIYNAAIYCAACGEALRTRLAAEGVEPDEDSNVWPAGPYPNGGGEADTPQHCDSCGLFLQNVLTEHGDAYTRQALAAYVSDDDESDSWALVADRAEEDGRPVLALWARHYYAAGQ